MRIILFLWGLACTFGGAYLGYRLVDILFFQGYIGKFSTFMVFISLLGLLICITLIYFGIKLITVKPRK